MKKLVALILALMLCFAACAFAAESPDSSSMNKVVAVSVESGDVLPTVVINPVESMTQPELDAYNALKDAAIEAGSFSKLFNEKGLVDANGKDVELPEDAQAIVLVGVEIFNYEEDMGTLTVNVETAAELKAGDPIVAVVSLGDNYIALEGEAVELDGKVVAQFSIPTDLAVAIQDSDEALITFFTIVK